MGFFIVPTAPSAHWTAPQVVEALPCTAPPRFLLRNKILDCSSVRRVESMGLEEVVTAPEPPWWNPCFERLTESIRRECLDYAIVFTERHPPWVLQSYTSYSKPPFVGGGLP
jgi:hypothetical protein